MLPENQMAGGEPADSRMRRWTGVAAAVFALAAFWISASRWADFGYRTFDLAFYVQALWKFSHGDAGTLSLLNVPMLGNHADFIVLLLVPLWALVAHPLLPVAAQVLAIASMAPVGYRIARRLGLEPEPAALMALATLMTPAAGFVAVHEFHPEALTAPFLLLAIDAFQRQSLGRFWLWFLATLACKENMTLLLAVWCAVNAWSGWRNPPGGQKPGKFRWILSWGLAPAGVALGWAALYAEVLSPLWNAGNVDYGVLYGKWLHAPWSGLPHAVALQLAQSIRGNLGWGLLLPLCGLPLLRPRWLLVAAPVAAQHLLSLRSSEWSLYFHYAAPLLPLTWVAACEAVAGFSARRVQRALAWAVALACVVAQIWMGPVKVWLDSPPESGADVGPLRAQLATIPRDASVVAGLPLLSHLAERESLYSLHLVLKGLKTLSLKPCPLPPLVDVVVVDYSDEATFDASAGYYHPAMRTVEGNAIPSSDQLLHAYLRRAFWEVESRDSLTVFRRRASAPPIAPAPPPEGAAEMSRIDPATALLQISVQPKPGGLLEVESRWRFAGERKAVPWMKLRLVAAQGGAETWLERGLCVPEGWDNGMVWNDRWGATWPGTLAPGVYRVEAVFFDNVRLRWALLKNPNAGPPTVVRVSLGTLQIP